MCEEMYAAWALTEMKWLFTHFAGRWMSGIYWKETYGWRRRGEDKSPEECGKINVSDGDSST